MRRPATLGLLIYQAHRNRMRAEAKNLSMVHRGWALQELIEPRTVKIYNQAWTLCSSKTSFCTSLSEIIDIESAFLKDSDLLSTHFVANECPGRLPFRRHRPRTWRTACWVFSTSTCHYYTVKVIAHSYGYMGKSQRKVETSEYSRGGLVPQIKDILSSLPHPPSGFLQPGSVQLLDDAVFSTEIPLTNKGIRLSPSVYAGNGDTSCSWSQYTV